MNQKEIKVWIPSNIFNESELYMNQMTVITFIMCGHSQDKKYKLFQV